MLPMAREGIERIPICALCQQRPHDRSPLVSLASGGSLVAVCHTCFCLAEAQRLLDAPDTRQLQREAPLQFTWIEACAQELYRACFDIAAVAARAAAARKVAEEDVESTGERSRSRSREGEGWPRARRSR